VGVYAADQPLFFIAALTARPVIFDLLFDPSFHRLDFTTCFK
jgi:hypothetical protein